jgi:hypothetical protein
MREWGERATEVIAVPHHSTAAVNAGLVQSTAVGLSMGDGRVRT